jgi:hypothetical protein
VWASVSVFFGGTMNLESFVTACFQKHLAADLLAVSVRPMAGTMHVRVTVGGHLAEAKAVAEELMAELAELDRSVHVSVELGKGSPDCLRAW